MDIERARPTQRVRGAETKKKKRKAGGSGRAASRDLTEAGPSVEVVAWTLLARRLVAAVLERPHRDPITFQPGWGRHRTGRGRLDHPPGVAGVSHQQLEVPDPDPAAAALAEDLAVHRVVGFDDWRVEDCGSGRWGAMQERSELAYLQPQIRHNIGLQVPTTTRLGWTPSIT